MDDPSQLPADQACLERTRRHFHCDCFACGNQSAAGLQLRAVLQPDGSVSALFRPEPWMRGYADRLQGGIIAALLDSAMTQCLFARGVAGVTGDLSVRFRLPAPVHADYQVRAAIVERRRQIYRLQATLCLNATVVATATARFVPIPAPVQENNHEH